MAIYDVKAASINSDGFSINITFDTMGTGGTYDFGLGSDNDPTNLKITLNLTSPGYVSSSLSTITRTIKGVPDINLGAMRLVYPNDANPDETVSGSDVIIRIALSENIYDGDTSITIDMDSGFYTESGNPNNSVSGLSVTNNSTLDYPRVIGNWGNVQRKIVDGNFDLEFLVFHGCARNSKQVESVKFTITDESANSVNYTITDMSMSSQPDVNAVILYRQTVNVSTLDTNEELTCRAECFPWVGDANSVLDTSDAVNTFPTPLYTNLKVKLYKSGETSHCVVDVTNGSDITGTVYATQGAAESAYAGDNTFAFQTTSAALTALQTYNNSNYSRNHAGGGFIYLPDGTTTHNSNLGGTLTEWVTITKLSTATKSTTILQAAATNADTPTFLKIDGISVTGVNYFDADNTYVWFNDCDFNTTGTLTIWDTLYLAFTFCTGTLANEFNVFSTGDFSLALLRSCNVDDSHLTRGYTIIGNNNVYYAERSNTGIPFQDGLIFAYNTHYGTTTDTLMKMGEGSVAGDNIVHGIAIVQNVFERHGDQTQPLMKISADGTITTTNNVLFFYNTIAGARCNYAYNDTAPVSGPFPQTNWFLKNNILEYNNKDDTFGNNSNATGSWSVGYATGYNSNLFTTSSSDEWFGEFQGLWMKKGTSATPLEPDFVDDQSADGGDAGGGDYHLNGTSPVYSFSHDVLLPFDIEGTARSIDTAIGAYSMALISYELICLPGVFTLTGSNADLLKGYVLNAESGSYTLTGSEVDLLKGYIINIESGVFTLTGSDVDLIYSGSTKILTCEAGVFTLTGSDAQLLKGYVLNAESGVFALTGSDVDLIYSGKISAVIRKMIITAKKANNITNKAGL